jgi:outer membrane protein assembly factor BamB
MASDWPMFRKDIIHSGWTSDNGSDTSLVQWSYTLTPRPGWDEGDLIWSSPVVVGSYVYFTSRDGYLYCLRLSNGTLQYRADVGDTLTSTPTISDGKAYFLSGLNDRVLYCYDLTVPTELWHSEELGALMEWEWFECGHAEAWVESSPAVVDADSVAFIGCRNGKAYCIWTTGPEQGSVRWDATLGTSITSSPALHDGKVYIGAKGVAGSNGFYCLDADSGYIEWQYLYERGNPGGTMSSATIVDGFGIYVGVNEDLDPEDERNFGGKVLCFTITGQPAPPDTAAPRWSQEINCDVRGTPAVVDGRVYVTTGQGLFCFNAATGDALVGSPPSGGVLPGGVDETWSSISVSTTLAEGPKTLLYVGEGGAGSGRSFWCLNTALDTVWYCVTPDTSMSWPSPAVADGRAIFCTNKGTVYCIRDNTKGRVAAPIGSVNGYGDRQGAPLSMMLQTSGRGILDGFTCWSDPLDSATHMTYEIAAGGLVPVRLRVFDAAGRVVRSLVDSPQCAGIHRLTWNGQTEDGATASSGIYYCRLDAGGACVTKSIVLIR